MSPMLLTTGKTRNYYKENLLLHTVTSTNCISIILPPVCVQTVLLNEFNEWNNLPESVDSSTLSSFKRTIKLVRFRSLRF